MKRALALTIAASVACSGKGASSAASAGNAHYDPHAIRYRLKLRHNPVDPGEAFRCYGKCQEVTDPKAYVECLASCPGFEKTPGITCDSQDIPPDAACLTVRKVPLGKEPDPGLVVLGVIGSVALVVGLASVCSLSNSTCGASYAIPPPK